MLLGSSILGYIMPGASGSGALQKIRDIMNAAPSNTAPATNSASVATVANAGAGGGNVTVTYAQALAGLGLPPQLPGKMFFVQGDAINWTFNDLDLSGVVSGTKLWVTIKAGTRPQEIDAMPDSQALLQIERTAGLLYVNGGTPQDASNGVITVDPTAGTLTVTCKSVELVSIPPTTNARRYMLGIRKELNSVTHDAKTIAMVECDVLASVGKAI